MGGKMNRFSFGFLIMLFSINIFAMPAQTESIAKEQAQETSMQTDVSLKELANKIEELANQIKTNNKATVTPKPDATPSALRSLPIKFLSSIRDSFKFVVDKSDKLCSKKFISSF